MSGVFRPTIEMRPSAQRIGQVLEDFYRGALELRPAFERIVEDFLGLEAKRFSRRGGWKPLSPAYAARKARDFPGAPPMVRTGRMMAALTGRSGDFRANIEATGLTVEVDVPVRRGFPLWAVHQHGAHRGDWWQLPRRPVLAGKGTMRKRWAQIFRDHLAAAAAGMRP